MFSFEEQVGDFSFQTHFEMWTFETHIGTFSFQTHFEILVLKNIWETSAFERTYFWHIESSNHDWINVATYADHRRGGEAHCIFLEGARAGAGVRRTAAVEGI